MLSSISVVIPTKNVEKYLEKCVNSLLNQKLLPNEIIIIDNNSTDKTQSLIEDFRSRHSDIIKTAHCTIPGAGPTRQKGIEIAKSEFIAFLDADDYYHPSTLYHLYRTVQKSGAAFGRMVVFTDENKIISVQKYHRSHITHNELKKGNLVGLSSVLIKRELLKQINGFDLSIKYAEDYDLHLRITRLALYTQSPNAFVFYRHSSLEDFPKKKVDYLYWEGFVCAKNGFFPWRTFFSAFQDAIHHFIFWPIRCIRNLALGYNYPFIKPKLLLLPFSLLYGYSKGSKSRK